jgi:hypothetical protein
VKKFPEVGQTYAIRSPTISASSRPRIFGLSRERGITAGAVSKTLVFENAWWQPMTEHELLEEKEREIKAEERRKYFSKIFSAASTIIAVGTAAIAFFSVFTKYGTEHLTSRIEEVKYQTTLIQAVDRELRYLEDHVSRIDETIKSITNIPEGSKVSAKFNRMKRL